MKNKSREKKSKMKKIINQKTITITTIILYAIAMITFELMYCNSANLIHLMQKQEMSYNFSLCRIVIYIVFFICYFIFKNKFIEEAIKVSENKYKRILIYITLLATIVSIAVAIYIVFRQSMYIRAMAIALIAMLMGSVFVIYVSNNHIKNIIVTVVTIGMVFSFTTKFNHALDEKKHFMSAVNISYFNFDYANNPITDSEIEKLPQLSKFTTIDEFLKNDYTPQVSEEVNMEDVPSTPAGYNFLMYLVSAMGIFVARLLGGSIIDLYIVGRIFNLILYGVLIGIAVKLLPYKKNIFMAIFLMPMALVLATSYSIDGICIGVVSIFIAYCLKLKKERETITLKDFLVLVGLFAILLLAKTMAYLMVGLMVFTLPIIPTLKKNKKYLPIIVSVIVIVCIILGALVLYMKNTKITSDTRANGNISVSDQLNNLLHHPIFAVRLMILHTRNTLLNFNWLTMLNYQVFFTDNALYVMLPLMLFLFYVALTEDDYNFKIKDKTIMIASFFLTFFMTSMVLYLSFTEVGKLSVDGYQARYIFPILSLLLFSISNHKVKSVDTTNRNMNISIVNSAFIMVSIALSILV